VVEVVDLGMWGLEPAVSAPALETEVNELKAVLRTAGLIRS
jgi:hypothetical protein